MFIYLSLSDSIKLIDTIGWILSRTVQRFVLMKSESYKYFRGAKFTSYSCFCGNEQDTEEIIHELCL